MRFGEWFDRRGRAPLGGVRPLPLPRAAGFLLAILFLGHLSSALHHLEEAGEGHADPGVAWWCGGCESSGHEHRERGHDPLQCRTCGAAATCAVLEEREIFVEVRSWTVTSGDSAPGLPAPVRIASARGPPAA